MRARQPFDRLRELLRAQITAPLAVSDAPKQYRSGDEFSAYAEVAVQSGEDVVVAVVRGYLPEDAFIAKVWHKRALEVWMVDPEESTVTRVARDGTGAILDVEQVLTSPVLPGVTIPVSALFVSH